jgi:signal transduction histidine kinase
VRRSRRSSVDDVRTKLVVLCVLGAVAGVAAEWVSFGWDDPRRAVPDLLTGWTLIACGLAASAIRPVSHTGSLLTATGFAWFASNFAGADVAWIAWLGANALYLHRGPLVHAVLTYPRGRASSRLDRGAVAVGYATALVTAAWDSRAVTIALAALMVGVAVVGYVPARGLERRERRAALQATAALGVVLVTTAATRLVDTAPDVTDATLILYEVTLCALAVALLAGLVTEPWQRGELGDLVAEVGESRPGPLRDAFARALGDPSVDICYRMPGSDEYVDSAGRRVDLPKLDPHRRMTRIERDGTEVAVLVHDPAVLDDPLLGEALASATRLAADNTRLQAEIQAQVRELEASRLRLVAAADEERRRLERRLHDGAEHRLAELRLKLDETRTLRSSGAETAARVEHAADQLESTLAELSELATGLHPRALSEHGLGGALDALATRTPLPVELTVPDVQLPSSLEAAVYFVCSEGVANAVKHASAASVEVAVTVENGTVAVTIADDGVGGADLGQGSGLRGLSDRVAALGGAVTLVSPRDGGTRLEATLPVGRPL